MTDEITIASTIKWRGSVYNLETLEGDTVHWTNPVSRFAGHCPVESWKSGDPYDGHYGWQK